MLPGLSFFLPACIANIYLPTQQSDRAPSEAPSSPETQQEAAIRSLLFTNHDKFNSLSPEIQQQVLLAFDWLLRSQETQDSLQVERRAKQAEADARQAEADWLANAICFYEDRDLYVVDFLCNVFPSDDDAHDSPAPGSDAY